MEQIDQREKTLVFCATRSHALAVRDLINQIKTSTDPNYCQRVTANDGELGEQHLRDFQDNEKTIPTILTTSQKLSTGVDARNIRNIVLMRPDQLDDRVQADHRARHAALRRQGLLHDLRLREGAPSLQRSRVGRRADGAGAQVRPAPLRAKREPAAARAPVCGQNPCVPQGEMPEMRPAPLRVPEEEGKVKLADGKERTIQHMMVTSFWHPDGTPMSAQQFMEALFGKLPEFFKDEDELRASGARRTRARSCWRGLAEKGFGHEQLAEMQKIIDAEKSDLFDVLAHVAYACRRSPAKARAANAKVDISTTSTPSSRRSSTSCCRTT
jgi:type I restriction enzyme, R subunit